MAHPHAALRQRLEGLNLYLVGMMGSGKSTAGRHLADLRFETSQVRRYWLHQANLARARATRGS